ncbi:hypothetical protein FRC12_023543, partial [Ceratobasidium sp. 428]
DTTRIYYVLSYQRISSSPADGASIITKGASLESGYNMPFPTLLSLEPTSHI